MISNNIILYNSIMIFFIVSLQVESFKIYGKYRTLTENLKGKHLFDSISLSLSDEGVESIPPFQEWYSPLFPKSKIDTWWVQVGDSLLTVGAKGVQQSHINSASELLTQHNILRVKLASDRCDPYKISKQFIDSEILSKKAEILQIKKREFMIGMKPNASK